MLKKLISISLVAMMLSVSAFANPYVALFDASVSAEASDEFAFKYAESKITSVTEGETTHLAELPAWDGKAATEAPATTTIGEKTYYQVEDGADLAWFAEHVNGGETSANAILVNDINLNSKNWISFRIGTGDYYRGTFDGNGHTIYNFYISAFSKDDQGGLFRSINTGAVIKDLSFENAKAVSTYTTDVTNPTYTAIVCGIMNDGTIQNVNVSGIITVGSGAYANSAGSIASVMYKGTIENCYSDATIDLSTDGTSANNSTSAADYGIGGIVGSFPDEKNTTNEIIIRKCGFEGIINAPKNSRVGGIAGNLRPNNGNFLIENCYNTGNITGLRQVAGILGWATSGAYQKTKRINNNYNAGNIVAKSVTNSYAAGISNGAYGTAMSNNHSTGDVSVAETGKPTFNSTCGLLFTNLYANTSSQYYTCANSAYCNEYTYTDSEGTSVSKHSVSTKKGTYSTGKGDTKADFANGTALTTIGKTNYTNLAGLNNGYPVFTWQTSAPLTNANTYYVADGSLTLALDTPGSVSLEIAPLGGSATVNGQTITEKGTYTIEATNAVSVTGQALITIDLMNQRAGSAIEELEATAIRAEIGDTARTIVLAFFNGDALEKVVYAANATQAVIDLTGETVIGKTLKAFVWENGTLAPIAGSPYELN